MPHMRASLFNLPPQRKLTFGLRSIPNDQPLAIALHEFVRVGHQPTSGKSRLSIASGMSMLSR
jgi:hypothetical protein